MSNPSPKHPCIILGPTILASSMTPVIITSLLAPHHPCVVLGQVVAQPASGGDGVQAKGERKAAAPKEPRPKVKPAAPMPCHNPYICVSTVINTSSFIPSSLVRYHPWPNHSCNIRSRIASILTSSLVPHPSRHIPCVLGTNYLANTLCIACISTRNTCTAWAGTAAGAEKCGEERSAEEDRW